MQFLGNLFGRSRHAVGVASENLHPKGPFFGEELQLLMPFYPERRVAVRGHELRNQEPHAVAREHPAQPAEGRVGHPVHRA